MIQYRIVNFDTLYATSWNFNNNKKGTVSLAYETRLHTLIRDALMPCSFLLIKFSLLDEEARVEENYTKKSKNWRK
jgi:hypothetical protein